MKAVNRTDITPSSTGWQDIDLTSYFGSDAGNVAGVLLEIVNNSGIQNYTWGAQHNSSTDDVLVKLRGLTHIMVWVGVDSNDILEIYVGNTTTLDIYLLGYLTNAEAGFAINRIDKSASSTGWQDVDISSDTGSDTAKFALLQIVNTSDVSTYTFGLRCNSSTDDAVAVVPVRGTGDGSVSINGAAINVDSSEIFEQNASNLAVDLYLIGWIKNNVYSDWTNRKAYIEDTTFNSYVDVDVSADVPSGNNGVIFSFDITNFNNANQAIRKNGETSDTYYYSMYGLNGWVAVDTNRIFEQKISSTIANLYLLGYTNEPSAGADVTVNASIQALTFSIPVYAVTATRFVTITPTVLSLAFSIPTYTIIPQTLIAANVQSLTFSIPAYVVTAIRNVTLTPLSQNLSFSIPVYTVTAIRNIIVSANVQSLNFSLPIYTINVVTVVSVNAQTLTFTIPSYTVIAVRNITIACNTQTLTFSIPSYVVRAGVTAFANVVTSTFSIPTYTVTTTRSVTVNAAVGSLTFSIPTYIVIISQSITINANVLSVTFTIPAYSIVIGTPYRNTYVYRTGQLDYRGRQIAVNVIIQANVQTLSFSIPTYTIIAIRNAIINANVQPLVLSIPTYIVSTSDVIIPVNTQILTFSIPIYTVTAIRNVIINTTEQTFNFSIPNYTITAIRNITYNAGILSLIFTIPAYSIKLFLGNWELETVHSATWTEETPHTTIWTEENKHTAIWTEE